MILLHLRRARLEDFVYSAHGYAAEELAAGHCPTPSITLMLVKRCLSPVMPRIGLDGVV